MGANNVAKKNGQLLNSPRPTMIQETEYDTRAVLITHLFEDEVKQKLPKHKYCDNTAVQRKYLRHDLN